MIYILESVCDDCGELIDEAPELCVNRSEYDQFVSVPA